MAVIAVTKVCLTPITTMSLDTGVIEVAEIILTIKVHIDATKSSNVPPIQKTITSA